MAVFASRQIVIPTPTPITVTITGSGEADKCYATINGTQQYSAGTHEVNAGDTITFGVHGSNVPGYVKVDGTKVLEVTNPSVKTYDWTVPRGISTVEIAMEYSSRPIYGRIIVTTA